MQVVIVKPNIQMEDTMRLRNRKPEPLTRNIRKPGDVGNLNFYTFTQNCNGLISWSFEIPASAYCHPLYTIFRNDTIRIER